MDWEKSPVGTEQMGARISVLPESLRPIKDAVLALAAAGVWIEGGPEGPLLAGARPDIAPFAYDIVLFAPLSASKLEAYQTRHEFRLPKPLLEILSHVNGGVLFDIKLYGAPPSIATDSPSLDRSRRLPLNIASGRYWRSSYAGADTADVLIASRNVGDAGQVGYFMDGNGRIIGRGNGSSDAPNMCGPWAGVGDWLSAEMA
tara:strand:- start:2053 stop:2658 length:606 start_codon:yes stop_codon:yes gene_type:complete